MFARVFFVLTTSLLLVACPSKQKKAAAHKVECLSFCEGKGQVIKLCDTFCKSSEIADCAKLYCAEPRSTYADCKHCCESKSAQPTFVLGSCLSKADRSPNMTPAKRWAIWKSIVDQRLQSEAQSRAPGPLIHDIGLSTPESVLYDAARDRYLVSNINGDPLTADGNGFISSLSPDGTVQKLRFIDGARDDVKLDAPKGMALVGNMLYVADITQLRLFDVLKGVAKGSVRLPGATFVNDLVAAPDGSVYASDSGLRMGKKGLEPSGSDAIWKIRDGKAQLVLKSAKLLHPNGLALRDADLIIATFGDKKLLKLDEQGTLSTLATLPAGSLDGLIALADGSLLVSSWQAQSVYFVSADGEVKVVATELQAPADMGYDARQGRLLVPLFQDNALRVIGLGSR